ncbi:dTDP-4-dehydrorhamnose reductase [Aquimarina aquimarini]|uniref:dTDP-4-dehydrorhamnose reductase n=1 Tax=Aquimarina aquimarini TaxID=1191734 RepID=UPI001F260399|nr:dTDP-4-dehydrorhamnose reductase [Aquimarina aquimarini]
MLVTGAGGQLGQCISKIEDVYSKLELHFASSKNLGITKKKDIQSFFADRSFDFVINCAAYTNVEQAEREPEKAFKVNAEGVKNLAEICRDYNATLIHISTDYVFDGEKRTPYTVEDTPNPINQYGKSKLAGEKHVQDILEKYFIIRTSWLYSEFGKNFYKTILEKSKTEAELTITTSEIGTPTNANDLAKFILKLIQSSSTRYGIYHFSNRGEATWYDFAEEILRILNKLDTIKLEKTDNYSTFVARPKYSVLDVTKVIRRCNFNVLSWQERLKTIKIDSVLKK